MLSALCNSFRNAGNNSKKLLIVVVAVACASVNGLSANAAKHPLASLIQTNSFATATVHAEQTMDNIEGRVREARFYSDANYNGGWV